MRNGAGRFLSGSVFLDMQVEPDADNWLERPLAKTSLLSEHKENKLSFLRQL